MFSNLHTWKTIKINMLLDSKECSLHQRWAEEDLSRLQGTGNKREMEAVQLIACEGAVDWGTGIVKWSPGNDHRMRQTRKNYSGLWNWTSRRWSAKIQSGKGQTESCDPYQRQHKGQKGKRKGQCWSSENSIFIHFLIWVHSSIEEVHLNSVAIEENLKWEEVIEQGVCYYRLFNF